MPSPIAATVYPASKQWVGIGREVTTATAVLPAATIPVEKGEPDEKPNFLEDKSMRGTMTSLFGLIQGTRSADFSLSGPVYLDTIGYMLHNLMGDYQATGSSPASATTLTAPAAAGATSLTVASGTAYTVGLFAQVGDTSANAPAEIVKVLSGASTSITLDPSTPLRFAHASSAPVALVSAPFTHIFSVKNDGNGQPPTHTITHYSGITDAGGFGGTFGARQYAYACFSEISFDINAEQLFTHDSKATSYLGAPAASQPVNTISAAQAQPAWKFLVGIGGPATGGTLVSDVCEGGITITRALKPRNTADGSQDPFVIARNDLTITGKFTELAQNEKPMTNMLQNIQPQVQLTMTNGLSGANLLAVTFDCQKAAYDTSKLNSNDELEYDVTFKAIDNTTNAGASGGYSPGKVTIQNAVPTY